MNRWVIGALALSIPCACAVEAPPVGPERGCVAACAANATQCSPRECVRGCRLVLDRLVEGEGGHVIACVAKRRAPCDDRAWAHCATLVGPYADGGPPAPPPPSDFEDDTE